MWTCLVWAERSTPDNFRNIGLITKKAHHRFPKNNVNVCLMFGWISQRAFYTLSFSALCVLHNVTSKSQMVDRREKQCH